MDVVGWLFLAGATAGFCMAGGMRMCRQEMEEDHRAFEEREELLRDEYDALARAWRLDEAFWQARESLRTEARPRRRSSSAN